jgi:hypothetical protein
MKLNNNHILLACVAVLAVLCVLSVSAPLRFGRERQRREEAVKERLLLIRSAETAYLKANGSYANLPTLVGGGWLADSLQYIPYSRQAKFHVAVSTQTGRSGARVPLMECAAGYHEYLCGLDEEAVAALIREATGRGEYPGLKFGDIASPNNNEVNW